MKVWRSVDGSGMENEMMKSQEFVSNILSLRYHTDSLVEMLTVQLDPQADVHRRLIGWR
jgi:hypothetical protein